MPATQVQAVAADNGPTNTATTALTLAATTAGNTLIACVWVFSSTLTTTVTDNVNAGNWSQAFRVGLGVGGEQLGVYYKDNSLGGVTTVTTHTPANPSIAFVFEYSGLLSSGSFDQSSTANTFAGQTWTSAATPTTTQANELLIGIGACPFDPAGLLIDSPWVKPSGTGIDVNGVHTYSADGDNMVVGTQIVSATGAYTATGTNLNAASGGADSDVNGGIATFKIAATTTPGGGRLPMLGVG